MKMTMMNLLTACALGMTLVVSAAPGGKPPVGRPPAGAPPAAKAPARPAAHPAPGKVARAGRGGDRRGHGDGLSPEDRRLVSAIDDVESLGELMRLLPAARASRNPEVRQSMIEALEDQGSDHGGERCAQAIAAFIVDPDEEVADAAFSAWTSIVDDLPAHRRAAAIVAAAQAVNAPAHP